MEKSGKTLDPVPKNHFEVSVCFVSPLNTFHIFNKDRNVVGILTRSPGSEEVYDKMKNKLIKNGIVNEAIGQYSAYFYAINKGAILEGPKAGGHTLEINMDKRVAVEEKTW